MAAGELRYHEQRKEQVHMFECPAVWIFVLLFAVSTWKVGCWLKEHMQRFKLLNDANCKGYLDVRVDSSRMNRRQERCNEENCPVEKPRLEQQVPQPPKPRLEQQVPQPPKPRLEQPVPQPPNPRDGLRLHLPGVIQGVQEPEEEEETMSYLEDMCYTFMDSLEHVDELQGFYYDEKRDKIVLHIQHGETETVLREIQSIYPSAEFLTSLRLVEKTTDAELQSACFVNGNAVAKLSPAEVIQAQTERLKNVANYGTITGVFRNKSGGLYAVTALHVFSGENHFGTYTKMETLGVEYVESSTGCVRTMCVDGEVRGVRGPHLYGRRRHYVDIAAMCLDPLPDSCTFHYKGLSRVQRFSIPTSVQQIVNRTKVQKFGATSGPTTGTIVNNNYFKKINGKFYSGMIVVRSDTPGSAFTDAGDSGALVTGVGPSDQQAYAIHMSLDKDHEHLGERFPASIMCRLDTSLQLLADDCGLNLEMAPQLASPPSPLAML